MASKRMDRMACRKCAEVKPIDGFEQRPGTPTGYRRTCKACRKAAKNATNNRYYHRHKERLLPAWREWRRANPERVALSGLRWYLKNSDKKKAYNRAYYQKHRERLIRESVERRRRRMGHQLDQGWSKGLLHSRIELEAQRQHWGKLWAAECVADLYDKLTPAEREYCEAFMADDIAEIPERVLESIREKMSV